MILPPSQKDIDAEIERLIGLRSRIPVTSLWGSDHIAALDAQVSVLRDGMTEDASWDKFVPGAYPDNVRDCAAYAACWLEGKESVPPSVEWENLAGGKG